MSEAACHYALDKSIGRYFLPGCMGGAIYGKNGCTCYARKAPSALEVRIADLERRVASLANPCGCPPPPKPLQSQEPTP